MKRIHLGKNTSVLNFQVDLSEVPIEVEKLHVIITNTLSSVKTLEDLKKLHDIYVNNILAGHVRYSIAMNLILNDENYYLSRGLSNVNLDGNGIVRNIPFEFEIYYDSVVNSYSILPGNSSSGVFANIPTLRDEVWYNSLDCEIIPKQDYVAMELDTLHPEIHYHFRYDLILNSDDLVKVLENTPSIVRELNPLGAVLPRI